MSLREAGGSIARSRRPIMMLSSFRSPPHTRTCRVKASLERDAHVRRGQRRRVVDAVPYHCHDRRRPAAATAAADGGSCPERLDAPQLGLWAEPSVSLRGGRRRTAGSSGDVARMFCFRYFQGTDEPTWASSIPASAAMWETAPGLSPDRTCTLRGRRAGETGEGVRAEAGRRRRRDVRMPI